MTLMLFYKIHNLAEQKVLQDAGLILRANKWEV